ncbi:MAG: hypothetical protein OEX00_09310, partial [Gammaproteobacteria bacterium]|nr:hypothetical protein [Gammaproteobacteria bacterium]
MSSKLNLVVWFGLGFGLINLLVFISFIIVPTEAPPTDVVAEHKEGAKQLTLVRELASTGSEEPKIVVEERAGSLSDRLAAIKKKQITALNELESSSDPRTLSNSSGASGRLEKMFETQRKEETEQVCYKIGPLYKTNDVSRLKSGLREVGIKGKEEVVNPKDFEGYWVYLA